MDLRELRQFPGPATLKPRGQSYARPANVFLSITLVDLRLRLLSIPTKYLRHTVATMASEARPMALPAEIIHRIVSIVIAQYIDNPVVGPLSLQLGQGTSNTEEVRPGGGVGGLCSSQLIAMSDRTWG